MSGGIAPVIRPLASTDASACDAIALSLPYHFGNAEGRRACAMAVRTEPGLVALDGDDVAGFLTVERHGDTSAEITWLAVRADRRGRGLGRALVGRLRDELRREGLRLLLVFTLGPSTDEGEVADSYAGTRAFYAALGFIPAREFLDLWPGNAALLFVLPLGNQDRANGSLRSSASMSTCWEGCRRWTRC